LKAWAPVEHAMRSKVRAAEGTAARKEAFSTEWKEPIPFSDTQLATSKVISVGSSVIFWTRSAMTRVELLRHTLTQAHF